MLSNNPDEKLWNQGSVDFLCAKPIKNKIKDGDNFAIGCGLATSSAGTGQTMTFRVPDQNGDIGDENKIIIELVKARGLRTLAGPLLRAGRPNSGQ